MKEKVETIDITPTWSALLPVFMAALEYGTESAKDAARSELRRIAQLADCYVASQKEKAGN